SKPRSYGTAHKAAGMRETEDKGFLSGVRGLQNEGFTICSRLKLPIFGPDIRIQGQGMAEQSMSRSEIPAIFREVKLPQAHLLFWGQNSRSRSHFTGTKPLGV